MTAETRADEARSYPDASTLVPSEVLEHSGVLDLETTSLNRVEDSLIESIDLKRRALLPHVRQEKERTLLRLCSRYKKDQSPARKSLLLRTAKALKIELARDDRLKGLKTKVAFAETAAIESGVSKKTIERLCAMRLLPDLVQAVAGGQYDTPAHLAVLAAASAELQMDFARVQASRREEDERAQAMAKDKDLYLLPHGVLDALDKLGRNDSPTRRRLAEHKDMVAEVGRMERDAEATERRAGELARRRDVARAPMLTGARDALSAAYDAATLADREHFLEVHGLRRATIIPNECISIAFDAVNEDAHAV